MLIVATMAHRMMHVCQKLVFRFIFTGTTENRSLSEFFRETSRRIKYGNIQKNVQQRYKMEYEVMGDRIRFFLTRISERLWVKPLAVCVLSIAGVFFAKMADNTEIGQSVPEITRDSVETLLKVITSSMLVIATFTVASMVSAFNSASNTATPRSFSLVISDDVSQNALSTFIGAFIFGIVALIAFQNGYYDEAGRFALFVLTLMVFTIVIITFVRWVDRIARLGRLGTIVDKVEAATAAAIRRRQCAPSLGGVLVTSNQNEGQAIYGESIGYVQRIDVLALQKYAEKTKMQITVVALPGTFAAPGRALAYVSPDPDASSVVEMSQIARTFLIGDDRTFDDDPRFGLVVLSEIASRALSPAVNDPGTAINIIGTFVRLFSLWNKPIEEDDIKTCTCDRVQVNELSLQDMFDDAFSAISRDGAGMIEVVARLQKAFGSLVFSGDATMRDVAMHHARLTLARAEKKMEFPEDLKRVQKLFKNINTIQ